MCGINGILRLTPDAAPIRRDDLLRTREALRSRGPDGEGEWWSEDRSIALGHRRLAILDLSPAGDQPMVRAGGRHVLVHNGEIYNFRQLRRELEGEGVTFSSDSDTEVLLALYARHGLAMLPRLRGMYAFALWDADRRRLLLARDPLGIKPLYYTVEGGVLRFASQVKALVAGGGVPAVVEPAGLAGFLLWGAVPEPWTFYRGVRALPAGHHLVVEDGRVGEPRRHYRFGETAVPEAAGAAAAVEESLRAHLVSDVPVALFLSAGLDSSLLAALARRHLPEPPVTLTVAFAELAGTPLDEAPAAAVTARALGTRHVERRMGREDFRALWPEALRAMDQPSIDGFNTFVVSRVAREEGLKVVLSGLGGDELLGSYPSFADLPRWARSARWARRIPGAAAAWPALARRLAPERPKLAALLARGGDLAGAYLLRRGLYLPEELPALLGPERAEAALAAYDPQADAAAALAEAAVNGHRPGAAGAWQAVHAMETGQYLKNQLLRDADWAGMAHSLEIRVPFVDAWLREQLARLAFEPARSRGKAALARQAAPELPAALFRRPKSGFFIPVAEWMAPAVEPGAARGVGGRRGGAGSRRLARRVLAAYGVELGRPDRDG